MMVKYFLDLTETLERIYETDKIPSNAMPKELEKLAMLDEFAYMDH